MWNKDRWVLAETPPKGYSYIRTNTNSQGSEPRVLLLVRLGRLLIPEPMARGPSYIRTATDTRAWAPATLGRLLIPGLGAPVTLGWLLSD